MSIDIFDPNIIFLSETVILDKITGEVTELTNEDISSALRLGPQKLIEVSDDKVDIVYAVQAQKIELGMSDGSPIIPVNGFLIEVYASGSDGKLTRMYESTVIDPITNEIIREGFSRYLTIDIDK